MLSVGTKQPQADLGGWELNCVTVTSVGFTNNRKNPHLNSQPQQTNSQFTLGHPPMSEAESPCGVRLQWHDSQIDNYEIHIHFRQEAVSQSKFSKLTLPGWVFSFSIFLQVVQFSVQPAC